MASGKPRFLAGDRKIQPDGSIHLDAIFRSLVAAFAMLGGGICTILAVVTQNLLWAMIGALGLPFIVSANRRRTFVFDVPKRALLISDPSGKELRRVGFDEIRTFDLVREKSSGPWTLVVNEEPLCWVQGSYLNRDLKGELAAVLAARPAERR